jgi:hypothetical protein
LIINKKFATNILNKAETGEFAGILGGICYD